MTRLTPKQKRSEIKRILSKLDDDNRSIFKRMYSNNNLEKDIDLVVDDMPARQLDWALQQCKNSYHKIFKILAGKA